jgi:nucleoside-diphosphate-sugar epimerase
MKILVTGASGFLGLHVVNNLAAKGHEIVMLDMAPLGELEEYPKNTKFFQVDIRNRPVLEKVLAGEDIEMIVHGAAALPLWSRKDIFETNVQGTRNVSEIAQDLGIKRVCYVSSTAVYGVPEKHPIYEDDPLIGVGPYGESKILAENVCKEFREKGMVVPIIRPKTFVGTVRMGVFGILYEWVMEGRKIPVIGDGTNRYQLLEVEDLADAIALTLTEPEDKVNDTFNVGAVDFNTVNEDVGALCEHAGTGARVMHTPAKVVKALLRGFEQVGLSPLYQWVYDTADKDSFVSVEKIQKTLGWQPKYSNAAALIRSYDWFKENYQKIKSQHGVTHTVIWKEGILGVFKKIL